MKTSQKLQEYLESEENQELLENNSHLITLKEILEEIYCLHMNCEVQKFREKYDELLEKNKKYLKERELKVLEDLKKKEINEDNK